MRSVQWDAEKTREKYNYKESGLPNIVLNNIPVYRCPKCKEMEVEIQCAEELRFLIAGILLFKPINLIGAEAR